MDEPARHPSLFSQHMPVRPCEDPPYLGRDVMDRGCAVYAIVDGLAQLGLADKVAALLHWLGRFEGLEKHLEEELDPTLCVRQIVLQQAAETPLAARQKASSRDSSWRNIVGAILEQPFVHTCSDWSGPDLRPRVVWDPLAQPFLEFLAEGREGEDMATWMPEDGNPDRARRSSIQLLAQGQGTL
ncbi:hypothetical protein QRO08_11935 [Paracidovorax citrulli]|nr:hypothetical protein [Paracidovorax citrulli]PVY62865.1 hypothetical protein C8E08_0128 [Paracidovorax citrulli]REG68151.1 hypothetical protein C8E07_1251 [Paracidovorax citrulli]RLJ92711.1 hypothetical protein C8E06_1253 [Paracidovorax citrulli]UMT83284.1 hypothetical protein FRC75_07830 [Paracidovorax citrulli]WIY31612.1 hypothetical protein QRO09_07815 [Paracidovorax citrulli]